MSQPFDAFRIKLLAVVFGGGALAVVAGMAIANATYVPVWLVFVAFLIVTLPCVLTYWKDGIAAQNQTEALKRAEEATEAERRAQENQRIVEEEAALKKTQDGRALNRAIDQLLDFAEDLGAGASKDRLISAMSESVSRIEPHKAYLELPKNCEAVENLQLVLSKLDAARLSDTVTAIRIRRLLDKSLTV